MTGRIGKYMVEKELGRGGFGKVYLAFDPDVGQPVAIKKLLADGDLDLLKRFQLEIRTTAGLRHKNIVTIHASGEEGGDPYLVMEFLEGQTLKQIMQEHRPLSLLDKVRIMTQVAEGLAYAHSKGVVHRDVKPENIMLLPDDNVKIMDFGIALGPNRNTAVTQTGGIIGTPAYFAPEQLQGLKATQQTDIFSFGDVYYELLSGVHPFEQYKNDWKTLQIAIMSYEPRALGDVMPGCPEALETMVHRTLAKEPEFRYQKFEEVQLDSEAILVDLKHEGAAAILREVASLEGPENLRAALSKINQAYQLAPGNREVRRRRDELNLLIQKEQVRTRVAKLVAEADSQMSERRYAEAVQSLETAVKLDSTNVLIMARLDEATARRDGYVRANRLIAEARFRQQKGFLTEAEDLLHEALAIDPDHTEAVRLSRRVREELERRKRQQAIQSAREHLAARRFADALAVLGEAEGPPGAGDLADLRAEIQQAREQEERRLRTERFNLAVSKTRETMEAGDLERARQMVDRLDAHFALDPGAPEVLRGLRERLEALIRVREIAQYQQKVHGLLEGKSYREAADLLGEALRRFPGDTGLERLNKSAEELYRVQRRSEALAAVLQDAAARRDAGELQAALASISKARQDLGDEAALVNLARDLETEIETQRYCAALDSLLRQGRELLAAGKYSEIDRLDPRGEFGGEAEVRALREAAREAAAIEEEHRFVEAILSTAGKFQSEGKWTQALGAVEQGLARYPQSSSLTQIAQPLRDRVELERRRSSIEQHRTLIRQGIQGGEWKRVEAALQKARAEFPGDRAFDDLAGQAAVEWRRSSIEQHRTLIRQGIQGGEWKRAEAALLMARAEFPGDRAFDDLAGQVQSGLYETGWRALEAHVNQHLAANALSQAAAKLEDQATRAIYAGDPRWAALAEGVARRHEYEEALREAERQRIAGRLSEAENLLTEVLKQGPPDKRADQMRGAIQVQRSETLRQQAITRIAQGIREQLSQDDLAQAGSELAAARTRYPGESAWGELQADLDARQHLLRRRAASIERHRTLIRQEMQGGEWKRAEAALQKARVEFPGDRAFDDLAGQVPSGLYEAGWRELETRVNQHLAANALSQAAAKLEDQATRAIYAGDPRWAALAEGVARRHEYEEALREAERQRIAGRLSEAENLLTEVLKQGPPDKRADQMRGAIQVQRSETLRQQAITRIAQGIREQLSRDDLAQAESELAAARTRYPGESAWDELQADLDARQHLLRRQADIAAAVESVRQSLDRGGVRQAAAALNAARARYPTEAAWGSLEAEIDARQASLNRLYEIAVAGENIRRWLSRTHAGADPDAGSIKGRCEGLLHLRREDLRPALSELDAARAKYPGEPQWDTLQAEIAARREFLDAESEIAERVCQCLEQDRIGEAQTHLATARAKYPDDDFWNMFRTEIGRREELQKSRAEVARIAVDVRGRLDRGDLREAAAQLAAARAKYPHEGVWAALQAEIDARQAALDRQAAIAAAARNIREGLDRGIRDAHAAAPKAPQGTYPIEQVWAVLQEAATRLDQARANYPGEGLWETLAREIAERQKQIEHEITEIVRACSDILALDWNARQLAAARTRYPGEPLWEILQAGINARRETLDQASLAEFEARIGECLRREDFQTALVRLNEARKRHPGANRWEQLEAEIDAVRRHVKRREDLDALERSVREQLQRVAQIPRELDWTNPMVLQWEAFGKADALLAGTRAKYPDAGRLAALESETGSLRAQWQRELAQSLSDTIRSHPHKDMAKWFGPQIRSLREKDPDEPLWARLEAEIQALEALLRRQSDVAAAGVRVREFLQRDDVRQAVAQLDAARASYPGEPLWSTLQAEIDARQAEIEEARNRAGMLVEQGRPAEAIALIESRFGHEPSFAELLARARAALEEQRRREARGQTRDRLLAIEQQIGTEARKRKRKELDGEAQRLTEGYVEDGELAAIAARIHARVAPPAAAAEPATPKAIPWKPIWIGVSAAAVLGAVLIVSFHKKPPEPPNNTAVSTVPIEIRTEPPGASLRVGDRTCVANCSLNLAPGTYRVDAQLKGFQPKHQTVVVDSSTHFVDLRLEPVPSAGSRASAETPSSGTSISQTARIELSGAPANVELSVDGKPLGRTDGSSPFSLPVKPGDRALEVTPGLLQMGHNPASRSMRQRFDPGQTVQLVWKSGPTPGTEGGSGTNVAGITPGITPGPKTTAGSGTTPAAGTPAGPGTTPAPATTGAGTVPPAKDDAEQRDWDKVRDTASAAQLRDFRGKYPNGKHAKEVEDALDRLAWSNANNLESLRSYLQEFPNGAHRRDATSRIDDLIWKAVDQKDTAGLQKFLKENPGNPHREEAQKILDQIANSKQDAEKLRAKLEADKKAILAVVGQFNAAFEHGNKRELSAVWPSASKGYLDAVDTAHRGAVKLDAPANIEIAGDTATLSCNVVSGGKPQPVKITLQRRGDGWMIVTLQKV